MHDLFVLVFVNIKLFGGEVQIENIKDLELRHFILVKELVENWNC